jgi:hypothetical protein
MLMRATAQPGGLESKRESEVYQSLFPGVPAMPTHPPNLADEYRMLAEKVRAQVEITKDKDARQALLHVAETWERLARWEDRSN